MKTITKIVYSAVGALTLGGFMLLSPALAVFPPPDGGYPGFNTAEGQSALLSLTTGQGNTAVGWLALRSVTEGSFNTAVGAGALLSNISGANTATGTGALLSNTTGGNNTANGVVTLLNNTTGVENTACGSGALLSNTTGGDNTATGFHALFSNTAGEFNTATGSQALDGNTTGNLNTATGSNSLANNTTGVSNTAVGTSALVINITGGRNAAFGAFALANCTGNDNTAVGESAGNDLTTGNGNVCIGSHVFGAAGESNTTRIRNMGSTAIVGGTNVVVDGIGGDGDQRLGYASSSRRYKEDIKPMEKGSETLFALKPVTFRAKANMDLARIKHYGLIAEEVATVDPDLVVYNAEGKPETLRFESINAMLLNEFLKEHEIVQEQSVTIAELKQEVAALTASLQRVSAQLAAPSPSAGGLEVSESAPRVAINNP